MVIDFVVMFATTISKNTKYLLQYEHFVVKKKTKLLQPSVELNTNCIFSIPIAYNKQKRYYISQKLTTKRKNPQKVYQLRTNNCVQLFVTTTFYYK